MAARLEAYWGAENGHVVDMAELPPTTYPIVFQRLKEGSAQMQYKWKFDESGNVTEGADYFLPIKVTERKLAEEAKINQVRQELQTHIKIPDALGKRSA